jgi:pSer/pThr/pTyr-binding forkhead associated (FHA) protein
MSRLILSIDHQVLAEYNMSKERYTIGRLPDNDVRIDNPSVSGHHSVIINILNDSFLEDLNSTNGTYVNGQLIKKHALQHGDVITIGQHQLRFVDQQVAESSQDEFEKTMVINPQAQDRAAQAAMAEARRAAAMAPAAPAAPPTSRPAAAVGAGSSAMAPAAAAIINAGVAGRSVIRAAKLQVLTGKFAGRELELVKALTTLGQAGGQVAAITRRADGYYIVRVSGRRGEDSPVVNGERIGVQARRLEDSDVIELAGIKMGFFAI